MKLIGCLIVFSFLGLALGGIGKGSLDELPCTFDDNTWCSWTPNGFKLVWPNGNDSSLLSGPRDSTRRGLIGFLDTRVGGIKSANLRGNDKKWWPGEETDDCFSFDYYLTGPEANLTVSLVNLEKNLVRDVFRASSKTTNKDGWNTFVSFVPFPKFDHAYVINGTKGQTSVVAISNLNVSRSFREFKGCVAKFNNECNFDTFLSTSAKQSCPWMIMQGSPYMSLVNRKPINVPGKVDHSTQSSFGGVLTTTFEGSLIQNWDSQVHFRSRVVEGAKCLTFWMNQPRNTSYQIDFKRGYNAVYDGQKNTRVTLWSSNTSVYDQWIYKNFTLNLDVPIEDEPEELYSIVFQMVKRNGSAQIPIALDSIKVRSGACPSGISCDFSQGHFCSFTNEINQANDNDHTPFMIGNGRLANPSLLTPTGFVVPRNPAVYAYIDSTGSTENYPKSGKLVQTNMQPGRYCVQIRYVASQEVTLDAMKFLERDIISTARTLPAAATWTDHRFSIGTSESKFKFTLRADVVTGFFAMSNISITNDSC